MALPACRQTPASRGSRPLRRTGAVLLTATLGAYALAMTLGRGQFGAMNMALLTAGVVTLALFLRVEATIASPLIRLRMFRDPVLSAGSAMSALVTTVVMASLTPDAVTSGMHATFGVAAALILVALAIWSSVAGRATEVSGQ